MPWSRVPLAPKYVHSEGYPLKAGQFRVVRWAEGLRDTRRAGRLQAEGGPREGAGGHAAGGKGRLNFLYSPRLLAVRVFALTTQE